ncbi:MAG: DUF805 domain-containing protein [Planctomycetota bacterium]
MDSANSPRRATIGRGAYAITAILLALLKYNLDRLTTWILAGRSFSVLAYWYPGRYWSSEHPERNTVLWTLALTTIPFVCVGIALTLRRLRDADLPRALAAFFFVPFLNLVLFLLLAILPSREYADDHERRRGATTFLEGVIPRGAWSSAAMSVLLVVPIATALSAISAQVLGDYGWGLFVGIPFLLGTCSAVLLGFHRPRSMGECLGVAAASIVLLGGLLFGFLIEGAVCLAMAFPLGIALALLGGVLGFFLQRGPRPRGDAVRVLSLSIVFLPTIIGLESAAPAEPQLWKVTTCVTIDAPPEIVWQNVVAFTELPPPREWVFRLGIAYPLRAEIDGHGAGAVRRCVFSTGAFVEPIEVWDEPRILRFGVTEHPPAMRETMWLDAEDPPHVNDFLQSKRGQFELVESDGRTVLLGTTWYTHRIWPAAYWKPWSDWILHTIHRRVLEHIRQRSEDTRRARTLGEAARER